MYKREGTRMKIEEAQLYKLNKQYMNLMDMLRSFNKDIHLFEERANSLTRKKELIQEVLDEAQRLDDEVAIEKANKKLDDINSKIDQLKTMVVILNDRIKDNQEKVNRVLEKVKKKPGVKKYVKEEMAKNYIKQIKYAEAQKRKIQNKKSLIVQLKQAVGKDPVLANNLSEILTLENILRNKERELIKYQKEIGEVSKGEQAVLQRLIIGTSRDIEQIKTSIEINKVSFKKGVKEHNIPITSEDIELISKQRMISNKKGNADPEKMLRKRIEKFNGQLKGYDKQIANNYTALNNLKDDKAQEQDAKPEKKQNKFKLVIDNLKSFVKRTLSRNKIKLLPAGSDLTDDDIKRLMKEVNEELADDDEQLEVKNGTYYKKYAVVEKVAGEMNEQQGIEVLKQARRERREREKDAVR